MQQEHITLPVGTNIRDRYTIKAILGRDGPDTLYLVLDQWDRQDLFLLKERVESDKSERDRFIFECVMLKQLSHPALPRVYRVFDESTLQRAYVLLEYIPGPGLETLRQQQTGKCFSLPDVMAIMAPIIDAVAYLHSQRPPVIHQNIKPANIIIPATGKGSVLVNISIGGEAHPQETPPAVPPASPGHGAPEQYSGKVDTRTDIYGLGATVYSLLTGIVPPDARDRVKQAESIGTDPLVPMKAILPTVSVARTQAIHRALSIEPEERFYRVEDFWQALNSDEPLFTAEEFQEILSTLPTTPVGADNPAWGAGNERPSPIYRPPSPAPVATGRPARDVPTRPVQRQSLRRPRSRKPAVLLLAALILFIVLVVGTGLWVYVGGHHGFSATTVTTAVLHKITPTLPTPRPTVLPTPTSAPGPYPHLASSYIGTIDDIATNIKTSMSLTGIQQSQENINGYLMVGNELQGNGTLPGGQAPFKGTINTSKHFQFIVTRSAGLTPLSFEGAVSTDGTLAGSYCSLIPVPQTGSQQGHCAGEYGIWSVIPV